MTGWYSIDGNPFPPGQTYLEAEKACNFSLYSKWAERVTLLLFNDGQYNEPALQYDFDPLVNKMGEVWFCKLTAVQMGNARYYAYRVEGPAATSPHIWHAFDKQKLLLDPYAKGVFFPPGFDRNAAKLPGSNLGKAPLGVLTFRDAAFDWEGDQVQSYGSDAVIYEMHVKGFTKSSTSGVSAENRGTYLGLSEKIPYLKELGVTIVELMPVYQYDPQEGNYWGYMPISFFAPHLDYAKNVARVKEEFKQMVKAFHGAGMRVILDVVYNHTGEADHKGPTYCFRGIDNSSYYLMNGDPEEPYLDFTGTGNTLHCANRHVRTLIVDSLRYWVTEMHVDGFRFDLASVFARNTDGSVNLTDPPLFSAIRTDPVLRNVQLIAEPWDAGGLYQLGHHFPSRYWHQWNGRFRDDIRCFIRGDLGLVSTIMRRVYGSDDLFPDSRELACKPFQSINYVASHDGFTLYDLVSYHERHNEANGHNNTDGPTHNYSWNCGYEGNENVPPEVLGLRKQQMKNFCALLFLSNGVPMFRAGDEFMTTQNGNSNPYNQDNATTWLNWDRLQENADMFRFFKLMIAFRKAHPTLGRSGFWRDDIRWYGVGQNVDMSYHSQSLAYCLHGNKAENVDLYVMINGYKRPLQFVVQDLKHGPWKKVIDTALESPYDISEAAQEPELQTLRYYVQGRSIVVLMRQRDDR